MCLIVIVAYGLCTEPCAKHRAAGDKTSNSSPFESSVNQNFWSIAILKNLWQISSHHILGPGMQKKKVLFFFCLKKEGFSRTELGTSCPSYSCIKTGFLTQRGSPFLDNKAQTWGTCTHCNYIEKKQTWPQFLTFKSL